jgi:hypothetical protein
MIREEQFFPMSKATSDTPRRVTSHRYHLLNLGRNNFFAETFWIFNKKKLQEKLSALQYIKTTLAHSIGIEHNILFFTSEKKKNTIELSNA